MTSRIVGLLYMGRVMAGEKLAVLIVTYGERVHLCSRVIDACMDAGVSEIVVVDNGSPSENAMALQNISQRNNIVKVIRSEDNLGSGAGVKLGMIEILSGQSDFLLILDDDTVPSIDCFRNLQNTSAALRSVSPLVVLYCYRGSTRESDRLAFYYGQCKKYEENEFCGFSVIKSVRRRLSGRKRIFHSGFPIMPVQFGPFGGMYLKIDDIRSLPLPREDYFLYADDHHYSISLGGLGFDQYLVRSAALDDIDVSFAPDMHLFSTDAPEMKIFYQIRNHTHLGLPFIRSKFFYSLNKYSFLARASAKGARSLFRDPVFFLSRLRIIMRAISLGERGNLGRNHGSNRQ